MRQRLHVITLAVDDLERALAFYRDGLGFSSNGITGTEWKDEQTGANGAIALFELDGGLTLSLYQRSDLAKDAEIRIGPAQSGEFSSASWSNAATRSTKSSREPKPQAPWSRPHTSGHGASTPAISAIRTATSGK
jgi:catechol 2,3-dioxygenase-like lactoylglutathione lyase family enzyme